MPQMIISLNYLIAAIALIAGFLLTKKGILYKNSARFMFFLAFAALIGGFVHHIELKESEVAQAIALINSNLPAFLNPLQLNLIQDRLWFVTIECIGFAEFYFMYLFIDPVMSKHSFIRTYLKFALGIYVIATLISAQYSFVILFHVFSHLVIISFTLYMYVKHKVTPFLFLALLAFYNLLIGIMQQLMNYKILPTDGLHYNDWYHIGVIFFIVALYIILTKGKLIEKLNNKSSL